MLLKDIENLTADQIRGNRGSVIEAAKKAPPDELAMRYVEARHDAKVRDEKLAEQGKTITTLNDCINDQRIQIETFKAGAEVLKKRCDSLTVEVEKLQAEIQRWRADVVKETQAKEAARKLASDRRAALADVMKFANQVSSHVAPLLAAE